MISISAVSSSTFEGCSFNKSMDATKPNKPLFNRTLVRKVERRQRISYIPSSIVTLSHTQCISKFVEIQK